MTPVNKHFAGHVSSQSQGFTLIELIMVLAISSLLAIILLSGQTTETRRVRFRDAVEQVVSQIERVKGETKATIGTDVGGNTAGRIVFGKAITFDGTQMEISTLTADDTGGEIENVSISDPQRSIELPWGAEITSGSAQAIVFGRNPANGIMQTYTLPDKTDIENASNERYVDNTSTVPITFEFRSPEDYRARITVRQSGIIELEYLE